MSTDPPQVATIWDALNSWGQTLPDWQRFIVSYAVRDGTLSEERIEEACRLFLRSASLDEGIEDLPSLPDSVTGRAGQDGSTPLSLIAVRNLKYVNAIPSESELTFGPGLTIVYGHNGTGKSGFARILSAACFSRSEQEIQPNVYAGEYEPGAPSADIVVSQGNAGEQTITVTQDAEHAVLRRASVFDSAIARVHLSEETPLGFKPTGFDVFDEITRTIGAITQRLDNDITVRTRENKFTQIFIEESDIATTVAELSADTDLEALRKLAVYDKAEKDRLEQIATQLAELRGKSPAELLVSLAAARKDIETVRTNINATGEKLGAAACAKFRGQLDTLREKTTAVSALDPKSLGVVALQTTGSEPWVEFVQAARTLGQAEREDYPADGDPCLLCHRPLDEPSASLIRRFWNFLDDETRVAAEKANEIVGESVQALKALDTVLLAADGRARAELQKTVPDFIKIADELTAAYEARRNELATILDSAKGEFPEKDIDACAAEIDSCIAGIEAREKTLREGKVDEEIKKLQAEHITLRHRQVLSQNINDIAAYVADLKWIEKAQKIKRATTTRFVTDKQRELFRSLIEGRYRKRLESECDALDCNLPIEFKARGSAGQTLRGLRIKGGHDPSEILSEGEQRAVALADFLTEVNLNPSSAAIILDDPVTSMDHKRKRNIAARLAAEAGNRQVIVFTHDLVFLSLLMEVADGKADVKAHWVDRSHDGIPGKVALDECPMNSNFYKTTHRAKEALAQAKKTQGQARVDKIRHGAGALRKTLEEIVIRDLFNGTVRRWDEQVRLGNVKEISWSDEMADEISTLQDDISRLIEGHSTSDEYAGGMPEPDQLEQLIARVDEVQVRAKQKRK